MQRKNNSSQQITKADLKSALEQYATKSDLKLLGNSLRGEMRELKDDIVGEIDGKNEKYKDEVMTKLDDIAGQLENLQ